MAATARALSADAGAPSVGGSARKGQATEPDWAKGLSLDEIATEREARGLPLDTDPDSIDDSDVREAFLRRLVRHEEGHDEGEGEHPKRGAGRPNGHPAGQRSTPRGRRRLSPTLQPPSRLSVADGSGFA